MIKQTFDYDYINAVLNDPEMFERISEDDQESIEIGPNENFIWLEIGDRKGLFLLHPHNLSTWMIHIHIPLNHREYSKQAALDFIEWVKEGNLPGRVNKLITEIPVIYPGVYHYAKKNFKATDEGVNRASILKDGQFIDQYRLGVTINELVG